MYYKIWNAEMRILVRKKKARGNAERKEEMKEHGHVSSEGPAGTRAQLCGRVLPTDNEGGD